MAIQYLFLPWSTYQSYIHKLAATLLSNDDSVEEIIAISRGGLTFGHLLSDHLRIPIWTIVIQSYTDIQTQGEIKITGKLQNSIAGKHILLVDDVSDSGKTLKRAVEYLKEAGVKKVTTMTMFHKPHSIFRPDYFAKQTSKWILFPHETMEMILLITGNLKQNKKDKAYIQQFLMKLGYTAQQISFAWRYHAKKKN